jgi:hypothetical protein
MIIYDPYQDTERRVSFKLLVMIAHVTDQSSTGLLLLGMNSNQMFRLPSVDLYHRITLDFWPFMMKNYRL